MRRVFEAVAADEPARLPHEVETAVPGNNRETGSTARATVVDGYRKVLGFDPEIRVLRACINSPALYLEWVEGLRIVGR